MQDPYRILGVTPQSTPEEIKQAYRKLAKQWHPDVSKLSGATAKFQEINEAYRTLSNPSRKWEHDRASRPETNRQATPRQGEPVRRQREREGQARNNSRQSPRREHAPEDPRTAMDLGEIARIVDEIERKTGRRFSRMTQEERDSAIEGILRRDYGIVVQVRSEWQHMTQRPNRKKGSSRQDAAEATGPDNRESRGSRKTTPVSARPQEAGLGERVKRAATSAWKRAKVIANFQR